MNEIQWRGVTTSGDLWMSFGRSKHPALPSLILQKLVQLSSYWLLKTCALPFISFSVIFTALPITGLLNFSNWIFFTFNSLRRHRLHKLPPPCCSMCVKIFYSVSFIYTQLKQNSTSCSLWNSKKGWLYAQTNMNICSVTFRDELKKLHYKQKVHLQNRNKSCEWVKKTHNSWIAMWNNLLRGSVP